ncbi:MAG TPA: 16S rRNA (guanine(966)-N(2))-methyltransferase RsmD [Vicinamibacterales bacterium]
MRVIAGSLKGRRLKAPDWDGLRPTSDKLRETLFNILAPRIAGARVVDAYAGTGAVGIEALSRGAAEVTFVEQDRRAQALIAENLARCGIATGYNIVRAGALRAFQSLDTDAAFDVILLDPPYAAGDAEVAGVLAAAGAHVTANGVVVLERGRRRPAPDTAGNLFRSRDVISGASALTFYLCRPLPSIPAPSIR